METRAVARAVILVAIGVALSPFTSIPIGIAKINPTQHFVNVIGAILLGPWWAAGIALIVGMLRNALGTGTLLAFPGGMIGAFLAGWVYWFSRNIYLGALGEIVGRGEDGPAFTIAFVLDATQPVWTLDFRVLRMADGRRIAEAQVEASSEHPGPAVEQLTGKLLKILTTQAGVRATVAPDWYEVPSGQDLSDYLLRLEQQLVVACMSLDSLKGGGLSGEHEILDGILHLCVRQPASPTVRMVFAQTLRQMQKVRPELLAEYKERIDLLQRDHPLTGSIARPIEKTIAETLGY